MAAKTRIQSKSGTKVSTAKTSRSTRVIRKPEVKAATSFQVLEKIRRPSGGWIAFWTLLLILLVLAVWKRNWVLAATVDNKPVWGFEVLDKMDKNYRKAELQAAIDNRVILDEAAKRNALPTPEEVKNRFTELENKYGGADTFNRLLEQQGQTRSSLESTLKLQLAMEKMYGNEINITDVEIDIYVRDNKNLLTASDAAGQRQEAKQQLTSQKQQEVFSQKFAELKQKANVRIF
ncbi:MAG: hypothetical protein HY376_02460 [Candidatus Blackburnbacteria bacterium]|nr:hypothetical protein [Candidatus Blackburnbacteria bacterium]